MTETAQRKRLNRSSKLTPLQLHRKVGMLRAGLTASDIAADLGVSRQLVSIVLRDKARSRRVEEAIATALGEPVDQLFPNSRAASAA